MRAGQTSSAGAPSRGAPLLQLLLCLCASVVLGEQPPGSRAAVQAGRDAQQREALLAIHASTEGRSWTYGGVSSVQRWDGAVPHCR